MKKRNKSARHFRRTIVATLIAWPLLIAHMPFFSNALSAEQSAEEYVQSLHDDVVAVLAETAIHSSLRELRLRRLFLRTFNPEQTTEIVLGNRWPNLTEEEQREYLQVIPAYLASVFAGQFDNYHGHTFVIVGTDELGEQVTSVRALVGGGGLTKPITIDISVSETKGELSLHDVSIDGISVVATKRAEFDSFLSREDNSTLITVLKKFNAEE